MDELRPPRKKWKISVEPVLFLYMSAFMVTSVVEEAFYVHKACRVNLNFSETVCDNISSSVYQKEKTQVQLEVSTFHQYENIAFQAVPIVLAFFLGSWSDKVGRKLPLILGLFGQFMFSAMIVLNDYMNDWPLETVLFTACFPSAITGGYLTIFMSSFSYIADTTTQEERTLRTTLLEVAYLLPMPIGVATGSYIYYNIVNKSFAAMFAINASLILLAIILAFLLVDSNTTTTMNRYRQDQNGTNSRQNLKSDCRNLCNFNHVSASVKAIIKPRPENRRMYLFLVLISMAMYTFQRDEKHMMYLYTQYEFNWTVSIFSKFRTFQSSFYVLGLLTGAPLMEYLFGVKDTPIIMIGALCHILARILFSFADSPTWLYVGAVVCAPGPIVAPVLRSLVSKLVPMNDRGKVYAIFTVADSAVPLVSGVLYSQVYNATIDTFPESIFLVTAVTQFAVFLIALYMNVMLRGANISQAEETTVADQEPSEA